MGSSVMVSTSKPAISQTRRLLELIEMKLASGWRALWAHTPRRSLRQNSVTAALTKDSPSPDDSSRVSSRDEPNASQSNERQQPVDAKALSVADDEGMTDLSLGSADPFRK